MSYEARRILTPRKRKEMEAFHPSTSAKPVVPEMSVSCAVSGTNQAEAASNRLLAGYMAYEFLTKGSLFGQTFEPGRAEAMPVEPNRNGPGSGKSGYVEVANIIKSDAVHIPGVVNPTQLAHWIQM